MKNIEAVKKEIKELQPISNGLPKGNEIRNKIDKRLHELKCKLAQLQKEQFPSDEQTFNNYKHYLVYDVRDGELLIACRRCRKKVDGVFKDIHESRIKIGNWCKTHFKKCNQ